MSVNVRWVLGSVVLLVVIVCGTGALTAELARRDCAARNEQSPWRYEYAYPFTCIYTGVK